jgi:hypothetical protein
MTDLSPAAQAVLHAYGNCIGGVDAMMGSERRGLVAALRAAADQVVPIPRLPYDSCCDIHAAAIRAQLLAIAAELQNQ